MKNIVCHFGKLLQKYPLDPFIRGKYLSEKRHLKRLIRQNNKKFKESINKKISDLEDNNPKEFWHLVNKLKNDKQNKTEIDLDETATYFECLYKPKKLSEEDKKVIKHLNTKLQNGVEIEELDNPISSDEILLALKSSKNGKSSGPDRIINEMIQDCPRTMAQLLRNPMRNNIRSRIRVGIKVEIHSKLLLHSILM